MKMKTIAERKNAQALRDLIRCAINSSTGRSFHPCHPEPTAQPEAKDLALAFDFALFSASSKQNPTQKPNQKHAKPKTKATTRSFASGFAVGSG
jgi:hypothetical protein